MLMSYSLIVLFITLTMTFFRSQRLKVVYEHTLHFGKKLGHQVLEVIRNGYALPFVAQPHAAEFANHTSALCKEAFVTSELERLSKIGCIREVSRNEAIIISPLGVVTNAEKNRVILDLRFVNSLLKSYQFKYEDLRTFRDIFEAGDWFFKFDYQSGYHHVDILPQHQQYLAFHGVRVM